MTPREIIAKHLCTMAAHDWDKIAPFQRAAFRTTANGFLEALHSAGYRILGPDEIDGPTVEKCAEVIEILSRQLKENDRFLKPEGVSELAAALCTLKEKQP